MRMVDEAASCSSEEIATNQLELLRSLLAELIPANRFHTQKLNAAGLTFDIASLRDFSARFPFTTKSELARDQQAHPPFGSNLTYPLERYTRYHQTSGTTAIPLRWLDTPESWDAMLDCWLRILRAAGVRVDDRVYFAFSFGLFIGFWLAFEAAQRLGCLCFPGGGLTSAARLRSILDNGATILCCTPTYALRLAEVAAEEGIDLSGARVRSLIVAGEAGGSLPAVRARLAERWNGADVWDHHGMTETGPVTCQCPCQSGVLHVIESAFFAEVVSPTSGEACRPGETGELILTTLTRTGSPLLRYRTGDLVKLRSKRPSRSRQAATPGRAQPCECGSHELALEGGILGRTDDMVIVRGVNVFPSAVDEIVSRCGAVAEYQVQLSAARALTEMSLQVEPRPDCADVARMLRMLESDFETALGLRVPITIVPYGTLPRFEMKARRWARL